MLGVAVSGGPDSLALLALAAGCLPQGSVCAATVDHGLRPESAFEAGTVAGICAALAIPHDILAVEVAPGNVQSAARAARYEALADWASRRGLSAIATAHHADDQAETLLMRLNRGSGVSGLAGVRARGRVPDSEIPLIRPLLGWRRNELAEIVKAAGLTPVDDPSNRNDRFDRVRLRERLATCDWLAIPALARSAAYLAQADDALGWAADREWSERVTAADNVLIYRPSAPAIIRIRIVERALAHFGGSARGSEVARLASALESGAGGTLGGVDARSRVGEWTFRMERPRRA